jgi:hypothetical protein
MMGNGAKKKRSARQAGVSAMLCDSIRRVEMPFGKNYVDRKSLQRAGQLVKSGR